MSRKTFFSALAVWAMFSTPIFSQFNLKIKAGANYSNVGFLSYYNQPVYTFTDKAGFHLGAAFSHSLDERMAVRAELLFNQKGASYKSNPAMVNEVSLASKKVETSQNFNLYYVSVPLLFQIYPANKVKFSLGGEVSILLNDVESPFKRQKDPHDIGFLAELGYEINKKLGVSLRYVHGLNPAFRAPVFDPILSKPIVNQVGFNRCFQFSVEYGLLNSVR